MDVQKYLKIAKETADAAGEILMSQRGTAGIEHKSRLELVTQADKDSEHLCHERLTTAFPETGYLGEEGTSSNPGAELQWVVDPLDGTNNYAHGIPNWSVSIALRKGGETIVAVVHAPALGETYTAVQGGGASLNGEAICVSTIDKLVRSVVVTGFPYDRGENPQNNLDHFKAVALKVQGIRRFGSAALDLCWVGVGRFEAFWELRLAPWDMAAGWLIAKEAGARITNFSGGPLADPPTHLLCTNGLVHDEMMAALAENPAWKADE